MYHIYHTKGFILKSKNIGEANKVLIIYTREFGVIRAIAQGIRLNKSKLRFALQDFSFSSIDLVQGREFWRITSASTITSFPIARMDKENLFLISRISNLLDRLCAGEDRNERIFDDLIQTLYLIDGVDSNKKNREALEIHLVLRIVHSLGYIGDSETLLQYLDGEITAKSTESLLFNKKHIINHINNALRESQL
ncbi:MAG: DNA repair protein RecO [Patescibacteria group bacterium]|nr:DNA repair protein RecO [Patescibacteria group bacterium]